MNLDLPLILLLFINIPVYGIKNLNKIDRRSNIFIILHKALIANQY